MRVLALVLLLLLGSVGLAAAGTITLDFGNPLTITTTAEDDAALARLVTELNKKRVAEGQPAWTAEQWVESVWVPAFQSYRQQAKELDVRDACSKWAALTPAQKQSIKTVLGTAPCK